jgi:GntR family transcriptional regulator, rspAB operon transcriptional repressor
MSELTLRIAEPIVPQIIAILRQAIIEMRLKPGEALSEKEIAQRYGVSRQPVREAFIKLAEIGLLQILPSRGSFVVKISMREVLNARFVREAIECAIVRMAAIRIDASGLARLEALVAEQKRVADRLDIQQFYALDEAFHRAIADCVECDYAMRVVESARMQTDRVRFLSLQEASPIRLLICQHEAIIAALRTGNPDGSESAMREHLREILSALPRLAVNFPEFFDASGVPDALSLTKREISSPVVETPLQWSQAWSNQKIKPEPQMLPERSPFIFKPSTPSAVDGIIGSFRAMIEAGQLKVGDDLPAERDLADQFGVGRNTVREAICKLEAYGIVETKNKRGARVVDRSVEAMMNILSFRFENDIGTFRDIQLFRTVVEAGLAAEVIAHATPADVAAFRRLNGRMSSTRDAETLSLIDLQFHQAFIRMSRNQTAARIYDVLSGPIQQIMRLGKSRGSGGERAMIDHEKIVAALEAGDVEALRERLSEHHTVGARYLRLQAEAHPVAEVRTVFAAASVAAAREMS